MLKALWKELTVESRYKTLGLVLGVVVISIFAGCQITVKSPSDPNMRITADQLQAEIDAFYAKQEAEQSIFLGKAKRAAQDINDQLVWRNFVYRTAITAASTGGLDWLQLLTGAGSILGIGAVADNVRYRIRYTKKTNESSTV